MIQPIWKQLATSKHIPTIWSDLTLDIYPRESKAYVHIKTYTERFIVALFVIDEKGKQCKCTPIVQWINIIVFIDTMDYYC